jgi:hypothetical protein
MPIFRLFQHWDVPRSGWHGACGKGLSQRQAVDRFTSFRSQSPIGHDYEDLSTNLKGT